MKTIVIIQARMGSSRLPGKILKSLDESCVLEYVVERCRKIVGISEVIVATTNLPQDDKVEQWCNLKNVNVFRGSELDVLDRYIKCAEMYKPDYIMRVTSDCPFVDFEMATEIVQLMSKERTDIVDIVGGLPRGLAAELISFQALKYINKVGTESRHREHVTYYAYEHWEEFKRTEYIAPTNRQFEQLRITVDTIEDYKVCHRIASNFKDLYISSTNVIKFLMDNPSISKLNSHIEQKPVI